MDVYLELGEKKVFAVAVDWPGLARAGRDEADALRTLIEYAPRYRVSTALRAPKFVTPTSITDLQVVERVPGKSTTDFGAPGVPPKIDERPIDEKELGELIDLQRRAWSALSEAADRAEGATLAPSGPRGGGRSLEKIRKHVTEAQAAYVGALGGKTPAAATWPEVQDAFIAALRSRARGEVADVGPRGGKRWPVRFAVRRSAWHALDHTWEIEDRLAD